MSDKRITMEEAIDQFARDEIINWIDRLCRSAQQFGILKDRGFTQNHVDLVDTFSS
ncbi:MAG: hypothetical protein V3U24_09180 [Candidatus Neomarinimicrobiota bacterium]